MHSHTVTDPKTVSRALALPARQVTALCKGAKKAGCIAEVILPGGTVVRLVPNIELDGGDDIVL